MKEINGNTLSVVRKKSIKRPSSGKVKEHCHDFKITIVGRKNKFIENAPGFCIDTDGILSDLLKNLDENCMVILLKS